MTSTLSGILSIAASGLHAADAQLAVTAENVANAQTPGYQGRRADLVELGGGGVGVAGITRDSSVAQIGPDGRPQSNVDLFEESINLVKARTLYAANAAVLKTADQMLGTLIDLLDRDGRRDHHRA